MYSIAFRSLDTQYAYMQPKPVKRINRILGGSEYQNDAHNNATNEGNMPCKVVWVSASPFASIASCRKL